MGFAFHSCSASVLLPDKHATSLLSTVSYISYFKLCEYRDLARRNPGVVLLKIREIKDIAYTEEISETQIRLCVCVRGWGGGVESGESEDWLYNEVISYETLGELRKVGLKLCAVGY